MTQNRLLFICFVYSLIVARAFAGGPDVQSMSIEDINTSVSSITSTLATKPSIPVSIANGGTGQVSSSAAFLALSGLKSVIFNMTLPSAISSYTTMLHGLTSEKIVSVTGMSQVGADTSCVPPNDFDLTRQWGIYVSTTNLYVTTGVGSSVVLGKPVRLLVWYLP